MRRIPNSGRPASDSSSSGQNGDSAASFTDGKDSYFYYEDIVPKANTVPLISIFKLYGIRFSDYGKKNITCPFKSHKGGRENSPSFYYYPETNSFHCFGCRIGGKGSHAVEFVAAMESITKYRAATKILKLFASEADDDFLIADRQDFSEQLEIMMDFSNTVREFRQKFDREYTHAHQFIEHICAAYDQLCSKHDNLNNEALRNTTDKLKTIIQNYSPSRVYIFNSTS